MASSSNKTANKKTRVLAGSIVPANSPRSTLTKEIVSQKMTSEEVLSRVHPTPMVANHLSAEEKVEIIKDHFQEILSTLGLDLEDDSLRDTPRRLAKMYVNELFRGLNPSFFPKITTIENKMAYDQMVVVQDIEVMSTCEHHFQPIQGFATVAYIPKEKVIGLSKINRVVEFFSKRPQVQERLTKQIADCLQFVLDTDDVAVHINARHFCVVSRGVEDTHSSTSTSDLRGHFKEKPETRKEFLHHIRSRL